MCGLKQEYELTSNKKKFNFRGADKSVLPYRQKCRQIKSEFAALINTVFKL